MLIQLILKIQKPLRYFRKFCSILLMFICLASFTDSQLSPLMSNLKNTTENFVGRKKFLKDMHEFFFNKNHNYNHSLVVSGDIGAGKTQVIAKYNELHKNDYEIMWWFDLDKELIEQYRNFAKAWNRLVDKHYKDTAEKNFLQINLESKDADSIYDEIYDRLQNTKLNWLIILDNVKDSEIALRDMPTHNDKGYGHIIISTSNFAHHANVMYLSKFAREESIELLLKATGSDNRNKANILAGTLNDYPLAVSAAGRFIASNPAIDIEEYNRLFLTKRQELWKAENQLKIKQDELNNYKSTVFHALSMDINKIKEESIMAYDLLSIAAFLDNENIPKDLLVQYVKANYGQDSIDIDFKNALSTLMKYSLLIHDYDYQKSRSRFHKDKESLFTNHEIMQIVMQDMLNAEEKQFYLNQAIIATNQLLPTNIYMLTDFLSEVSYLIPHITALNQHATNFKLYNNDVLQLNLRALEYNLPGIRNDKEAERLIGNMEEIIKQVSRQQKEQDVEIVQNQSLIKWLSKQHNESQEAQLIKQENKKHNDLLRIRFAIMKSAFLAWAKADYSASLKEALYAHDLIQTLPEKHPEETLMIYNRLARLYNVMGNNLDAFKYIELGKEIINNTPNIVGYQNDFYKILVKIYIDSGDFSQALKYSELTLALASQKKSLVGNISAHLINVDILIRIGKYEEAMQKLNELERVAEESLPIEHFYRANIMNYYSYVRAQLGNNNLQQDIKSSLSAQAMFKKLLGEKSYYKNRHVFMNHKFLGEIYEKNDNNLKAEEEYSTSYRILTNIYNHSGHATTDDLSDIYCKLAIINAKLKRPEEALAYLKLHQETFGHEHLRSIKVVDYLVENNVKTGL